MSETDTVVCKFKGKSRFGICELVHLLVAFFVVHHFGVECCLGFVKVGQGFGEKFFPTVDGVVLVSLGDLASGAEFELVKGGIDCEVVVLKFFLNLVAIDLAK